MSAEERRKILQMVEEGRISAMEAATLMRALDEDIDEAEVEVIESESGSSYERTEAPEFDEVKARARRFSLIPLWIGVSLTVVSAWIIFSIQQNVGANFWFYCMIAPLLLGVLLIALSAGGGSSRWVYVDVDRRDAKPDDGPRRITFGLPIPFGLVTWFFESFGHNINGLGRGKVEGILQMLKATKDSNEPLMINVDDEDAHVQVYVG